MKRSLLIFFIICVQFSIFAESSPLFTWRKHEQTEMLTSTENAPQSSDLKFTFRTAHFPPKSKYTLFSKSLGQTREKMFECIANEEGELLSRIGKEYVPLNTCVNILGSFLPGEPIEYFLVARKNKAEWKIKIIPNPLAAKDHEGRKVTLEVGNPERTLYYMKLIHFKPNEKFTITSTSGEEVILDKQKASDRGTMCGLIAPGITGQIRGTTMLEIHPIASEETLTIHYEWGIPKEGTKQ
jgi:hypothetical protein